MLICVWANPLHVPPPPKAAKERLLLSGMTFQLKRDTLHVARGTLHVYLVQSRKVNYSV